MTSPIKMFRATDRKKRGENLESDIEVGLVGLEETMNIADGENIDFIVFVMNRYVAQISSFDCSSSSSRN